MSAGEWEVDADLAEDVLRRVQAGELTVEEGEALLEQAAQPAARTAADEIRTNAVEARRLEELDALNGHKASEHQAALERALPSVIDADGRISGKVLMRVSCIRSKGKGQCDRRLAVVVPSSEGPLLVSLSDRRPLALMTFPWDEAERARSEVMTSLRVRCPSHGELVVDSGVLDSFRAGERATTADWDWHRRLEKDEVLP